jgi:hypothetical protein
MVESDGKAKLLSSHKLRRRQEEEELFKEISLMT